MASGVACAEVNQDTDGGAGKACLMLESCLIEVGLPKYAPRPMLDSSRNDMERCFNDPYADTPTYVVVEMLCHCKRHI